MDKCKKRSYDDSLGDDSSKKLKKKEEQTTPFTSEGKTEDEVKLVFDNTKALYVSKCFLILSSPVFEAMFRNDFAEKGKKLVKLPGKVYENFLELLDCINPGSTKDVNVNNVLRIAPIAEEYQIISCVSKCKGVMKDILNKDNKNILIYEDCEMLRNCLNILHVAISLSYQDIVEQCMKRIACYPFSTYGESAESYRRDTRCYTLFEKLPAEIRIQILSKRLYACETHKMIQYTGP